MSNFALDTSSSQGDIISSLNYALANLNNNQITANVIIDIVGNAITAANVVTTSPTGQVSSKTQGTVSYLYNYINVMYANNPTGSIGFSSNCTNKQYFGTHSSSTTAISMNPADYNWTQVAGGFGTTKGLYYTPVGGGGVFFDVATVAPSVRYVPVPDNTAIPLQNLANSVVTTTTINPGAVTNVAIAANTIVATNIQTGTITALQIAARTLTNAQVALGTITGNLVQSQTLTGTLIALNTITGNLVAQNTITGNLIVPGTITGNLIQANTIMTTSLQSYGVTPGVNSGYGFWLTSNVGDAYFGGNVNIGQNLYVAGLISSANLNANTVSTNTMQLQSVTTTSAVNNVGYVINNPTVVYNGTSGSYYNYITANLVPYAAGVYVTTPVATNTISGYIDVFGYSNMNGTYGSPQMTAELYRYDTGNAYLSVLSQTVVSTPSYAFYNGLEYTTQTLFPIRLSAVSIVDVYTPYTVPSVIEYFWVFGSLVQQTANVAPLQPNITVNSYGITVTNYKR